MEIIKIFMLITAISINSNELIQEYSYSTHVITEDSINWYGDCINDTIICEKNEGVRDILTRITIKHNLEDMDYITIYPDSISYTIRK